MLKTPKEEYVGCLFEVVHEEVLWLNKTNLDFDFITIAIPKKTIFLVLDVKPTLRSEFGFYDFKVVAKGMVGWFRNFYLGNIYEYITKVTI